MKFLHFLYPYTTMITFFFIKVKLNIFKRVDSFYIKICDIYKIINYISKPEQFLFQIYLRR